MISYAQAREDVLLHRALRHVHHDNGFYIDVGGFHPTNDSVTKHFYEHGWHGINVEPGKHLFPPFVHDRPRDINIQAAATDKAGEATFYEVENGQLCTLEEKFADIHAAAGIGNTAYTVPAMTLTQICEAHATGREIHFLKIDVEGHEDAVVRGMDFSRFRPWILVIEATEPNNLSAPTYAEWDPVVQAAGYIFVYTDVLNRYYVAQEHSDLVRHFAVAADDYVYARDVHKIIALEHKVAELEAVISNVRGLVA